ncbi:MAG: cell wall protein, partial [Acidimicrobiales bacterium]
CSDPVTLATVTADAAGNYATTVRVPSDTAAGSHTVVVSAPGGASRARATLTVAASSASGSASSGDSGGRGAASGALSLTGVEIVRMVLLGALALALGTLLVGAAGRRRW